MSEQGFERLDDCTAMDEPGARGHGMSSRELASNTVLKTLYSQWVAHHPESLKGPDSYISAVPKRSISTPHTVRFESRTIAPEQPLLSIATA